MPQQRSGSIPLVPPRRRPDRAGAERPGRRSQLLEAAGHVFAEKGFDRATGKEICERAGTNQAAINYYFGGMEGLYSAVIAEAHQRLVPLETLSRAIAGKTDAGAKLQAIIEVAVDRLTGPSSASWVLRVMGREFVAPSFALDGLIEKQGLAKARILKSIVAELTGLPEDHPAVARGCLCVLAPCVMLLIGDRRNLKRAFPNLGVSREDAADLARHLLGYAIAGLSATARDASAPKTSKGDAPTSPASSV